MKTLYESLLDTEDKMKHELDQHSFYAYFAECFVKTFGKIDRTKQYPWYSALGFLFVDNWKWDSWKINELTYKLGQMNRLIKKRYPFLSFYIAEHASQRMKGITKYDYVFSWTLDPADDNTPAIDWFIALLKDEKDITTVIIYPLSKHALKDKELLEIIDTNI